MTAIHREWCRRGLVVAVLGIHAGLLAWIAFQWAPCYDEPFHLAAGIRFWQTGHSDLDRGNPPLFRSVAALPVLLAKPAVDWHRVPYTYRCGHDFLDANGLRVCWLITLGRWACIPFSVLGAYVCYRWARQWYGYGAGMTALVLWCFSPNTIAFGHLITGDMAATSMGVVAFYLFWRWLNAPSWSKAAWAGVFWGLAELTKFVWLVLYPLWPLVWLLLRRKKGISPILVEGNNSHTTPPSKSGLIPFFHEAAQFVLMGLLSVWVINLGYAFEGSLDRFQRHPATDWRADQEIEGVRVARSGPTAWIRALPLPLPKDYVDGIGQVQDRSGAPPKWYLRGTFRASGSWYHYLYAILVKEPLGTLSLLAMATVLAIASANYRTDWRREALLLLSFTAVLGFVGAAGVGLWLRYALPVFPFLFLWASRTGRAWENRQHTLGVLAAGCLLWSVVSSLAVYPHSISYFNELTGGPPSGHWHLLDSNIDWGQDLFYLKKWLDEHPQAKPFHFAYYGPLDPWLTGIEFSPPPTDGPRPGWHAVSVELLRKPSWIIHNGQGRRREVGAHNYDYFWDLKPVDMVGYSIYIYHVSLEDANEVRAAARLPLLSSESTGDEAKKDGAVPVLQWLKGMLRGR